MSSFSIRPSVCQGLCRRRGPSSRRYVFQRNAARKAQQRVAHVASRLLQHSKPRVERLHQRRRSSWSFQQQTHRAIRLLDVLDLPRQRLVQRAHRLIAQVLLVPGTRIVTTLPAKPHALDQRRKHALARPRRVCAHADLRGPPQERVARALRPSTGDVLADLLAQPLARRTFELVHRANRRGQTAPDRVVVP